MDWTTFFLGLLLGIPLGFGLLVALAVKIQKHLSGR